MNTAPLEYRPLEPGDLGGLSELYRRVWPDRPRHDAYTAWAFGDPRSNQATIIAVDTAAGRIVGARPSTLWPFLPQSDPPLRVRQFHGTCVDPEYRRRGIFSSMTAMFLETFEQEDGDFIFNVSSDASRPGYEKLGWTYGPGLRRLIKPVRRLRFMWAMLTGGRRRIGGAASVDHRETGPFDASSLDHPAEIRRTLLADALAVDYRPGFLEWRLSKEAGGYRTLESDAGAAIYRTGRRGPLREVYLGDLWPSSDDHTAVAAIASDVVDAELPDMVSVVTTRTHPLFTAYRRSGFLPDPKGDLNLGTRAVSERGAAILARLPLAISSMDIDTF